jgi:hypothetical protein
MCARRQLLARVRTAVRSEAAAEASDVARRASRWTEAAQLSSAASSTRCAARLRFGPRRGHRGDGELDHQGEADPGIWHPVVVIDPQNGSNIRSSAAVGMPGPWSRTAIRTGRVPDDGHHDVALVGVLGGVDQEVVDDVLAQMFAPARVVAEPTGVRVDNLDVEQSFGEAPADRLENPTATVFDTCRPSGSPLPLCVRCQSASSARGDAGWRIRWPRP